MGKSGNPTQLNAWSSSLSSASSTLDAVVSDLKAASPYTLQDASFGNKRVTDGTTRVFHHTSPRGNAGYYTTQTKWVTESVLTGSGVAQNSGSFMTWLPGTVPSFGNTSGTWQGYAASMFANLLQEFVNAIEEIKNTIDQLSKELSALATSISNSRQWWKVLLGIIIAVVLVIIAVVINVFAPGIGSAILGVLSNGLRFLVSFIGLGGEAAGDVAVTAIEIGTMEFPSTLGAFSEEFGVTASLDTIEGLDGFGGLGDIFANAEDIFTTAPEFTGEFVVGVPDIAAQGFDWAAFGSQVLNWAKQVFAQQLVYSGVEAATQFIQNWLFYGSPFKGWSLDELLYIFAPAFGVPAAEILMIGLRGFANLGIKFLPEALTGPLYAFLDPGNVYYDVISTMTSFVSGTIFTDLIGGTPITWQQILLAMGFGATLSTVEMLFTDYIYAWAKALGNTIKGIDGTTFPKLGLPPLKGPGGDYPTGTLPTYDVSSWLHHVQTKIAFRGVVYPTEISIGTLIGRPSVWWGSTLAPVPFVPPVLIGSITPPATIFGPDGNPIPGVGQQLPVAQQQQDVITLNSDVNAQLQAVNDEISAVWYQPDSPDRTSTLQALYAQRSQLQAEIKALDHELGIITYEASHSVSSDTIGKQTAIITEQIQQIAQQTLLIDGASVDPFPTLPVFS